MKELSMFIAGISLLLAASCDEENKGQDIGQNTETTAQAPVTTDDGGGWGDMPSGDFSNDSNTVSQDMKSWEDIPPSPSPSDNADSSLGKPAKVDLEDLRDPSIVGVLLQDENYGRFTIAVRGGQLVTTLRSKGPFTLFAPVNDAFATFGKEKTDFYRDPNNRGELNKLVSYHLVSGLYTVEDLLNNINKNNGSFEIKTAQGDKITFMMKGKEIVIKDKSGNTSSLAPSHLKAANGMIHGINGVLTFD